MSEGTAEEARAAFRTLTVDLRDPRRRARGRLGRGRHRPRRRRATSPARVYRPLGADGPGAHDRVLPRRRLGDRRPRHPRPDLPHPGHRRDAVVVSRRLPPGPRAPRRRPPSDDAIASARWVSDHLADLGGDRRAGRGRRLRRRQPRRDRRPGLPRRGPRRWPGQLLFYPGTDFTGDYPSQTENAEGYFLDLATMAWFMDAVRRPPRPGPARPTRGSSPLHGDLAGWPRPSSSPPSSTRCATRATPTPTGWARPASRSQHETSRRAHPRLRRHGSATPPPRRAPSRRPARWFGAAACARA